MVSPSGRRPRRVLLTVRLRRILPAFSLLLLLLTLAAALRFLLVPHDPSVTEYLESRQRGAMLQQHRIVKSELQDSRRGADLGAGSTARSSGGEGGGIAAAGIGVSSGATSSAVAGSSSRSRSAVGGGMALTRELHWQLFPRLIKGAAGAGSGTGGTHGESDRERLLKRIERWSERPSSLCFGHGNVTIVTVTVDLPHEYVVLMRRNRLHYCTLVHECRFCEVAVSLDHTRPVAWTKVRAMQLVMSFSDTVVHMDADALIVNASISFPGLLAGLHPMYNTTTKDVVYTMDFQAGRASEPVPTSLINTGVYAMRSSNWSKAFLDVQYRFYRSSIHHKFWDQDAVMLYRMKHRAEFADHVAVIPYRYMNVPCSHKYNDYVPGDFIVHYAGGHNLAKYERLTKMFLVDEGDGGAAEDEGSHGAQVAA